MSEFNKYSTDGGATFIDVEDSTARSQITDVYKVMGEMGAKNIAEPVKAGQTITEHGVTYACGTDGTVTVTNTATADTGIYSHKFYTDQSKSYRLTGCPSGGSNNTYYIRVGIRANASDNWGTWFGNDIGNGLTIPQNTSAPYGFVITCRVMNGTSGGGKIFSPMVVDSNDTDTTYQPYAMTNKELTDNLSYKAGDTVNLKLHNFTGFISSGSKELYITIPLEKNVENITGVSFGNSTIISLRKSEGGYIVDSQSITNFSVSIRGKAKNLLSLTIKKSDSTAYDAVNNSITNLGFGGNDCILTFS